MAQPIGNREDGLESLGGEKQNASPFRLEQIGRRLY